MPSSWRRSHRSCAHPGPTLLIRSCSTRRLELAARTALLPHVATGERTAARDQIAAIASTYEAFGPPAPSPSDRAFESLGASARWLRAAIADGDLDAVDVAATWLGQHCIQRSARTAARRPRRSEPRGRRARVDLPVPHAPGLSAGRAHGRAPPAACARAGAQPELEARVVREPAIEHRFVAGRALRRAPCDAPPRGSGQRLHLSAHVAGRADGGRVRLCCRRRRRPSTSKRRPGWSCEPRHCRCCRSRVTTRRTDGATA